MVNKLKETFRDKSRDNLANTLIKLGIKAEMAERGMEQEKIGDENISIDHLKNMPKQEISGTIPQEVKSDEEEIPQIEMPKEARNFENFK